MKKIGTRMTQIERMTTDFLICVNQSDPCHPCSNKLFL